MVRQGLHSDITVLPPALYLFYICWFVFYACLSVEDDDNLITPRGYMNIENEGGTMERVTGLVWNVPAQYVDIFVDGVVINSNAKTYKDGQIEITGHFDSAAINVEDIHIELVYRNQNGTEYGVLSTVHFTLSKYFDYIDFFLNDNKINIFFLVSDI